MQLICLQAAGIGGIKGLSACADGFVAVKPRRGKQHTASSWSPSPLYYMYVHRMGRPCYCASHLSEAMSAVQVTRCCFTPSSQTAARTMHPYTQAAQCCRVSSGQQQNGESDWTESEQLPSPGTEGKGCVTAFFHSCSWMSLSASVLQHVLRLVLPEMPGLHARATADCCLQDTHRALPPRMAE